jgi:hypothetical protein
LFEKIFELFSPYELKARLFPALITVAPFGLSLLIWYPQLIDLETSVLTTFVLLILLFFLAKLARERGKKLQDKLLIEWGGFPSTTFLKHSDNSIDKYTKQRYHQYINKHVSGFQLPSKEKELSNPSFYDSCYNSVIKWLLEKTRDQKKYHLLYQDNINYGFSRNMVGIKPLGILFSILSLLTNLFSIYKEQGFSWTNYPLKAWISILISVLFISIWLLFVKKGWVKSTSEAYARTLLSCCEEVE